MTVWIIEPKDPLIARDGRPFNATPGVRAKSLPFPYPSTTAGGARTRAGQDEDGRFITARIPDVKTLTIRGPLLAELGEGEQLRLMAPAPSDALLFDEPDNKVSLNHLKPFAVHNGAESELPSPLEYVVGLPEWDPRKPAKDAPIFWYWDIFEKWLLDPQFALTDAKTVGHSGPQPDQRTHVAIDPQTGTSVEGMLFMTSGLTFWQSDSDDLESLSNLKRMALVVDVDGPADELMQAEGFGSLGGERRLMHWRASTDSSAFPPDDPPAGLAEKIAEAGCCRVILLTPGFYKAGWLPDVDAWAAEGVQLELVAAAVGKPVVISGWDMVAKGPKKTRRLAPAGSVYYLRLIGEQDKIADWVRSIWLTCLSDEVDDSLNQASGFGLAAVGVADGIPPKSDKEDS